MIVLPLGLGTELKKPPLVTLAICLVWIAASLIDHSDDKIFGGIFKEASITGVRDRARDLFIDYCKSRRGSPADCTAYAVLVWTGYPAKGEIAAADDLTNEEHAKGRAKAFYARMTDEHKSADALRKHLLACELDRRCFVVKDIVWRFLDQSHQHAKTFAGLKSYLPYARAMHAYRSGLKTVCAENSCLVRNNITVASLFAAQVRHGGLMHLLGNMLVFVVFGVYAEQRTRRLFYLLTVVIGGTLGMAVHAAFFSTGDTIALGGSANVSAAMGMFFVFFFRQNMRFLVWLPRKVYFGSSFPASVALAFPLVFVLSDVIGGFDSGFGDLSGGSVAHFAHLTGFLFGALVAYAITKIWPLPLPFIFEDEMQDMRALEASRDPAAALSKASEMVLYNPDNVHALEVGCALFLRWASAAPPHHDAALFDRGRTFLIAHLQTVCAVNARKNDLRYACELLSQVPLSMPFAVYLGQLGQISTLKLADCALVQGHPLLGLRLYDFFLGRFPTTLQRSAIETTVAQTLACLPTSLDNQRALQAFCEHHPASPIRSRLAVWTEERRSA